MNIDSNHRDDTDIVIVLMDFTELTDRRPTVTAGERQYREVSKMIREHLSGAIRRNELEVIELLVHLNRPDRTAQAHALHLDSDGLHEVSAPDGSLVGRDYLVQILAQAGKSPRDVLEHTRTRSGRSFLEDDVTLIQVQRR